MTPFSPIAYSVAMIAAFALLGGGLFLIARRRDWKRGGLMLLVALVIVMNVLIWTLPGPGAQS